MLTLIKEAGYRVTPSGSKRKVALYKCDCGKEKIISVYNVASGKTKSCGCMNIKQIKKLGKKRGEGRWNYKHGMYGTRFYNIYYSIIARCNDKNNKYYGGKGIKCEWETFEEFYKDMYDTYKADLTIDRIDSNKDYCKENCRWATYKEQAKEKVGKTSLIKNLGGYDNSRAVNQYSLDDKFIKNYKSARLASRQLNMDNSSITKCCKGKMKTAGGYKWEYA